MRYFMLSSVLFMAVVGCSKWRTSDTPKVQDKVTADAPRPATPAPQASPEGPAGDVQANGEKMVLPPRSAESQLMPENSSATTPTTK